MTAVLDHPTVRQIAHRFDAKVSALEGASLGDDDLMACDWIWVSLDMAYPWGRIMPEGAASTWSPLLSKRREWRIGLAKDVCQVDEDGQWRAHRCMDRQWYVYLYDQMAVWKGEWQREWMPTWLWQERRQRFAVIHRWAVAHWGVDKINEALQAPRKPTNPPHLLPRFGERR